MYDKKKFFFNQNNFLILFCTNANLVCRKTDEKG